MRDQATQATALTRAKFHGATMWVERYLDLLLVIHPSRAPSADDWNRYIEIAEGLSRPGAPQLRTLVLTRGGGPDAKQRAAYAARVKSVKVAVMTDSLVAKTILNCMALFNSDMRAFGANELDAALQYLESSADGVSDVLAVAERALATRSSDASLR